MGFQSGAAVAAPPGYGAGLVGQGSNQGLWQVLEDSRAVLIAADVPPDGPFPQDEKIKDGRSSLVFTPLLFLVLWCTTNILSGISAGVGTKPLCVQTRPGLVPVCWGPYCCLSDQFILGSLSLCPQPPHLMAGTRVPVEWGRCADGAGGCPHSILPRGGEHRLLRGRRPALPQDCAPLL